MRSGVEREVAALLSVGAAGIGIEGAWGPVFEGFGLLYIQPRMVPTGAIGRSR